MKALFIFASTHDVIRGERHCLKAGLPVQVIPVPREISSECGMALEIAPERATAVASVLQQRGIAFRQARR